MPPVPSRPPKLSPSVVISRVAPDESDTRWSFSRILPAPNLRVPAEIMIQVGPNSSVSISRVPVPTFSKVPKLTTSKVLPSLYVQYLEASPPVKTESASSLPTVSLPGTVQKSR